MVWPADLHTDTSHTYLLRAESGTGLTPADPVHWHQLSLNSPVGIRLTTQGKDPLRTASRGMFPLKPAVNIWPCLQRLLLRISVSPLIDLDASYLFQLVPRFRGLLWDFHNIPTTPLWREIRVWSGMVTYSCLTLSLIPEMCFHQAPSLKHQMGLWHVRPHPETGYPSILPSL